MQPEKDITHKQPRSRQGWASAVEQRAELEAAFHWQMLPMHVAREEERVGELTHVAGSCLPLRPAAAARAAFPVRCTPDGQPEPQGMASHCSSSSRKVRPPRREVRRTWREEQTGRHKGGWGRGRTTGFIADGVQRSAGSAGQAGRQAPARGGMAAQREGRCAGAPP